MKQIWKKIRGNSVWLHLKSDMANQLKLSSIYDTKLPKRGASFVNFIDIEPNLSHSDRISYNLAMMLFLRNEHE